MITCARSSVISPPPIMSSSSGRMASMLSCVSTHSSPRDRDDAALLRFLPEAPGRLALVALVVAAGQAVPRRPPSGVHHRERAVVGVQSEDAHVVALVVEGVETQENIEALDDDRE